MNSMHTLVYQQGTVRKGPAMQSMLPHERASTARALRFQETTGAEVKEKGGAEIKAMGGATVKETGGEESREAWKTTVRSLDVFRGYDKSLGILSKRTF